MKYTIAIMDWSDTDHRGPSWEWVSAEAKSLFEAQQEAELFISEYGTIGHEYSFTISSHGRATGFPVVVR